MMKSCYENHPLFKHFGLFARASGGAEQNNFKLTFIAFVMNFCLLHTLCRSMLFRFPCADILFQSAKFSSHSTQINRK